MEQDHPHSAAEIGLSIVLDWLLHDEKGRAIFEALPRDPEAGRQHLANRFKDVPAQLATFVSGSTIGKIVNIARARAVYIGSPKTQPPLSLPPARRSRKPFYGYTVDFVGRSCELGDLLAFLHHRLDGAADFAWWLWSAPGGQGKTRLADRLCVEALSQGWHCGFLPSTTEFKDWNTWIVDQPTLVAIDHIAHRPKEIRDAIATLSRLPHNIQAPLRLFLLERPFLPNDSWVTEFVPEAFTTDVVDLFEYAYSPAGQATYGLIEHTRKLGPLDEDTLWTIMTAVLDEHGSTHPDRDATMAQLKEIDPLQRPLFAILAAASIATAGPDKFRQWNRQDLVQFVLRREFRLWQTTLYGRNADVTSSIRTLFEEHLNVITFSTITGCDAESTCAFLQKHDVATPKRLLPDWLRVMTGYSAENSEDTFSRLEPDILGELFVLERLSGSFGVDANAQVVKSQTQRLLDIALAEDTYRTIDFVRRCVDDFPDHPSLERFAVVRIPEGDRAPIVLFHDYCVSVGQIAVILNMAGRADLAEQCFTQIIEVGRVLSVSDNVRYLLERQLAYAYSNRAVEKNQRQEESAMEDCNTALELMDREIGLGAPECDLNIMYKLTRPEGIHSDQFYSKTGPNDRAYS